jgi:hypothetical protein
MMNHEKDLDYIPQLPSSIRTLDFVNNYLPHINRQTFVNVSSNDINRSMKKELKPNLFPSIWFGYDISAL